MDGGELGKRDGMARAERGADPAWWVAMVTTARAVAEAKPYLFTDDVVRLCRERYPQAFTPEPRALGPLMRECCRLGYFEPTQDWVESTQAQCHRRPMRVWHSLIYRGVHVRPRRRRVNDPRQYAMSL
jgi:hypothetical protein